MKSSMSLLISFLLFGAIVQATDNLVKEHLKAIEPEGFNITKENSNDSKFFQTTIKSELPSMNDNTHTSEFPSKVIELLEEAEKKPVPPTTSEECVDRLNDSRGTNRCIHIKDKCHDERYKDILKRKCAKTCGYCQVDRPRSSGSVAKSTDKPDPEESTETSEEDIDTTTTSKVVTTTVPTTTTSPNGTEECRDFLRNTSDGSPGCLRYKKLCQHRKAGEFIRAQCPMTCGLCQPKEENVGKYCEDVPVVYEGATCSQMQSKCNLKLVRERCPQTCGDCLTYSDIACQDKSIRCDVHKCRNDNLAVYMQEICPVTCGLCDPSTGDFF